MSDAHHDSDSLMDFSESDSGSGSGAEGASKRPVSTTNSPPKVRTRGSPGRMHSGGHWFTLVFSTLVTRTASEPTLLWAQTGPYTPLHRWGSARDPFVSATWHQPIMSTMYGGRQDACILTSGQPHTPSRPLSYASLRVQYIPGSPSRSIRCDNTQISAPKPGASQLHTPCCLITPMWQKDSPSKPGKKKSKRSLAAQVSPRQPRIGAVLSAVAEQPELPNEAADEQMEEPAAEQQPVEPQPSLGDLGDEEMELEDAPEIEPSLAQPSPDAAAPQRADAPSLEEPGALLFTYAPDTPKEAKYELSEEDLAIQYIKMASNISKDISKTPKDGVIVGFEGRGPYYVFIDYHSAVVIAETVKTLKLTPDGPALQLRARRQDSLNPTRGIDGPTVGVASACTRISFLGFPFELRGPPFITRNSFSRRFRQAMRH